MILKYANNFTTGKESDFISYFAGHIFEKYYILFPTTSKMDYIKLGIFNIVTQCKRSSALS